ncbi:hypothetical protein Cgig2_031706 [Carnegiea gigantea]|uniref:Uncharacterized protein n=1 Tax=Carnegiea gigantea TaxID=171969 RepID=A0A9Q1KQP8_9CARY|nr:hypothetical protein Cgig2_031706 [Carnegiea gigantea]
MALLQLHPWRSSFPTPFTLQAPMNLTKQRSLSIRAAFSCSNSCLSSKCKRPYTSVMIVPTGVGAAIGGFAGDALPVARALASVVDCLISHPNVLNAAMLYWPLQNILYVEGYALDRFAEGIWALQPVHQNRVGLVLDAAIESELRLRHLQVADAVRASLGLPVLEYAVTDKCLEVEKWIDPKTGQSTGRIKHPDSLLRAVQNLVDHSQVNAIAVVGRFPDDDEDDMGDYREGIGVDTLAGVEAVISHLVVKEFRIPCAHAPALLPVPLSQSLSPKSAAEEYTEVYFLATLLKYANAYHPAALENLSHKLLQRSRPNQIGYTFLPCVLAGLSNAPQYVVMDSNSSEKACIFAGDVDSVILPIDACAGDGVLAFAKNRRNKPLIITVEENTTVLSDTPERLGIEVMRVSNYWEAIGVIAAHKAGIDPNSLRRNRISQIPCRSSVSPNGHNQAAQIFPMPGCLPLERPMCVFIRLECFIMNVIF